MTFPCLTGVPKRVLHFGFACWITTFFTIQASAVEHAFFHENILGTSLEFHVVTEHTVAATNAEKIVLQEIARLSAIYSQYDQKSEFSQLVKTRQGESQKISAELASTLEICDQWQTTSEGAFNPAVAQLSAIWDKAARSGALPDPMQMTADLRAISQPHWQLDRPAGMVLRTSTTPLSLNAIAKGVILDKVATKVLSSSTSIKGLMLNIGGDIRVAGLISIDVEVANPNIDAIGSETMASIQLTQGAVATSGNSERFYKIAGRTYSHIIDPRSGRPAQHTTSATVLAEDACTADVVATICSVLPIRDSVDFVNSLKGVECLLKTAAGAIIISTNWPQDKNQPTNQRATDENLILPEMLVQFEIAKPQESRRYRRPYVAVWIEDEDGLAVKTLSLFLMQNIPGPRWYRDLRRWYADDQLRKLVSDTDLIKTVSKPTRNPGKYKVVWNGKDDDGKKLKPGEYSILIETAREHGSYQLIKHKFRISESFEKTLKPNPEISAASIRFRAE